MGWSRKPLLTGPPADFYRLSIIYIKFLIGHTFEIRLISTDFVMDIFLNIVDKALSTDPLVLSQCSVLILSIGLVFFVVRRTK